MHVLIAEDQPDSREMFALAFRLKGHQVTLAYNGAEAFQAVAAPHPGGGAAGPGAPVDAVLMDGHLPLMDGLTATRRIRELPHARTLPIVFLTAFHYTEEEVRAAGANQLLCKPMLPQDVVKQLEALL